MKEKNKEPLFHIVKRDALPWYKSLGIRFVAILLALILCGIITTITTGINPLQVYQSIILGAFGSVRKTWVTFQNIAILLLIALALTPAFKMKFWNIGGEGQVLIGGLASAACMFYPVVLPDFHRLNWSAGRDQGYNINLEMYPSG